jgi:hypothetical protein
MLFTDGDEREVPLPQPSLFSICRGSWSRSKEELDEQLSLLAFHRHQGSESQEGRRPLITMPCITLGRPRVHIRTKVLLHHILVMPLLGRVGIDLHLGQKPKLRGGIPTSHSFIHHILSELCISMFCFLSFSLLFLFCSYFPKHKKTKIFLLFLFVCFFSFLVLVCFTF